MLKTPVIFIGCLLGVICGAIPLQSYAQESVLDKVVSREGSLLGNSLPEDSVLDIKGKWQQGQMLIGRTESGSKVKFGNRHVFVDDDGVFVFGLSRDEKKTVALTIIDPKGKKTAHQFEVKQREYNVQRVNGVPQRTVTPPAEDLKRIRYESSLMRQARAVDSSRKDFLQNFQWPVTGPISGVYGSQRVYNGKPGRPHFGVDVARPTGTQVVAPANGVVTLAYDDMFYNGGTLVIDHGRGIATTFIHLSKILVEQGQELKQGDPVAEIGSTGRATGPHLDWRINWFSVPLDPVLIVPPMPNLSSKNY